MSHKYLVLAEVEGTIRVLSMTSNSSAKSTEKLCRPMLKKLFTTHQVGEVWVEPWPTDQLTSQETPDAAELQSR